MGSSESNPYSAVAPQQAPKIIGVALNYLKEGVQGPPNPIVFLKSWSSIAYDPKQLHLPHIQDSSLIHELELGLMIGTRAFRVPRAEAMAHVAGYFILLDITDASKGKPGQYIPETFVKSQDNFCPVSPPIRGAVDPYAVELELKVNGQMRQKDFVRSMHFKIDAIIEFVSQFIALNPGDLILTGTPLGAGPLRLGDEVEGVGRVGEEVVARLAFTITN